MLSCRAFFLRSCGLLLAFIGFSLGPAWAQTGSGFYLSNRLGANFASGLDVVGDSNDRASVCDEFINPNYLSVAQYLPIDCTAPNRGEGDDWMNAFDGARGILAGAAVGYRVWGRLRFESEYFYRESVYNQTADVPGATGASGDKLDQELVIATDRIGSVTSHNLFGNLYFDLVNKSRFTPYVGFGGGVGFTDMDYGYLWARNANPAAITTGEGLPNADAIRRNLAGTTSSAQTELTDALFGYQVLFGVDYALTESVSLGVQGRWVNYDAFRDDGIVGDTLRSHHQPNLRRDGSEPVSGGFQTNGMRMFGVSVNLNYHF